MLTSYNLVTYIHVPTKTPLAPQMFILVGGSNFLLQRYGVLELSASHEGPESWETLGLGGFLSHGGTPNHPRYPRVGIQILMDFTKFHQPKKGFDATAAP